MRSGEVRYDYASGDAMTLRDGLGELAQSSLAARDEDEIVAILREDPREIEAHSARCAGDECSLSSHLFISIP